jgi:3-methyladenine DNA glycosylase AlkD
VKLGDIRAVAKKIKTCHELALNIWDTGNVEAQLLAKLAIKPKSLSAYELDKVDSLHHLRAGGRLAKRLCRRTASREGSTV